MTLGKIDITPSPESMPATVQRTVQRFYDGKGKVLAEADGADGLMERMHARAVRMARPEEEGWEDRVTAIMEHTAEWQALRAGTLFLRTETVERTQPSLADAIDEITTSDEATQEQIQAKIDILQASARKDFLAVGKSLV